MMMSFLSICRFPNRFLHFKESKEDTELYTQLSQLLYEFIFVVHHVALFNNNKIEIFLCFKTLIF